jgi:hypothetical protein
MGGKVTTNEGPGGGLGALSEFIGKVGDWVLELKFDPDDPTSVEGAVEKIKKGVDALAASYAGNPAVQSITEQMKVKYEAVIREARPEEQENEQGTEN